MTEAAQRHEEVLKRQQRKYGGEIVKGPGGGLSLFTEEGQRIGGLIEEERLRRKREDGK